MKRILIISGEGEIGTEEVYNGKLTARALKARLTKETAHGDRWAKAVLSTGEGNDYTNDIRYEIDINNDQSIIWALKEIKN